MRGVTRVVWGLLLCSCVSVPNTPKPTFGPTERVQPQDCAPLLDMFQKLLLLPRHSGHIVSNRLTVRTEEEQQRELVAFAARCTEKLVGQARRAVLSCFGDSKDAEEFLSCEGRF